MIINFSYGTPAIEVETVRLNEHVEQNNILCDSKKNTFDLQNGKVSLLFHNLF